MKDIIECPIKRIKVVKSVHCPDFACDEYCIYKPDERKHTGRKIKTKKDFPDDLLDIYKEQFTDKFGHFYLLGLLAYPKITETPKVINFVTAAISETLKGASEHKLIQMSSIDEKFRKYEKRKAERTIAHALDRLDRRLMAAWILLRYINKWGKSLNNIVEYILKKKEYRKFNLCSNRTSIIKNIWSESKPVLHIAFSVLPMLHKIYGEDIKPELDATFSLIKQIKKRKDFFTRDLCIIPGQIARQFSIHEKSDLLKGGWLGDILKLSKDYYDLLPALVPFLNKADLLKLS